MKTRVLVIGGYGNFGRVIARRLSREQDIAVIVAGRSEAKAKALAVSIGAEWASIDIGHDLDKSLGVLAPHIVIHTSGPFQGQDYDVAQTCIRHRCHYIDLADGRDYVAGIGALDDAAKANGVLVVSGASSVPALTSAIIDRYRSEFRTLSSVSYGIATAQKTARGLATTRAVLGYAGKPFKTLIGGKMETVHGWQSLRWRNFAGLGWRSLGNCDVPDLALFPARYPELKTIRFYAGLELPVIHMALWGLSWLVRMGLIGNLAPAASPMLALTRLFDLFGTDASGFFMELGGIDPAGKRKQVVFELTARAGDGSFIPCAPALLAALRLAHGEIDERGARPCVGLIGLDTLLDELRPLNITWQVRGLAPRHPAGRRSSSVAAIATNGMAPGEQSDTGNPAHQ